MECRVPLIISTNNDNVFIQGCITDLDIHSFVESSLNASREIERALKIGIQIIKESNEKVFSDYLKLQGQEILESIDAQVSSILEKITRSVESSLNPHMQGSFLSIATQAIKQETIHIRDILEKVVSQSTSSIEEKQKQLDDAQQQLKQQFLDTNTDGFVFRLRTLIDNYFGNDGEVIAAIQDEFRLDTNSSIAMVYKYLSDEIQALRDEIMKFHGYKDAINKTTIKGFEFEDVVQECLEKIARPFSDIVEYTGNVAEVGGSKKGDYLYTTDCKIVIDAKHYNKIESLPSLLGYLDDCLESRQAEFAIAVVPDVTSLQKQIGSWNIYGNRIVTALDHLEVSIKYIKGLYNLNKKNSDNVDILWVKSRLDDIQRKLKDISSIKSKITKLQNGMKAGIEDIQSNLDNLKLETEKALNSILEHMEPSKSKSLFT